MKNIRIVFFGSGSLGPLWISSFLRQHGHTVLFPPKGGNSLQMGQFPALTHDVIEATNPDLIGFSCLESNYISCLEAARWVKREYPGILTIFGGVYPTIRPEIIRENAIDIVCIGEGERPMLELCMRLSKNLPYHDIPSLHVKMNSDVVRNEPGNPIENLDEIPDIPREEISPYFGIYVGRGCPYSCSFCSWAKVREASRNHKLRLRSPRRVLDEIARMHEIYGNAFGSFMKIQDDTFLTDKDWLAEFLPALHKEFPKLKYSCCTRVNLVNEEVSTLLEETGCSSVALGIESGDEKVRNEILKKNITLDQIKHAVSLLYKHNMKVCGQWILGVPGEDISAMLKSMELHRELKDVAFTHICTPYYGTGIREMAIRQELIAPDLVISAGTYNTIVFNYPEEHKKMIKIIYALFPLATMPIDPSYLSNYSYFDRHHGQRDVNKPILMDHIFEKAFSDTLGIV
ncbi:MAG: hypothetical protein A2X49_15415 [Lentisphaerae bacterium GWF2_52_8]|nr:MAG: hypothetical protein A2X49_15415 [Lentisphaerae bacterium GWF2_52_8]